MSLYAEAKTYTPPPQGNQLAVLVDAYDDGMSKGFEGGPPKSQFRFVFELREKREDGKPFLISHWTSKSISSFKGRESKLTELIHGMMGEVLTQEQRAKFDLTKLIGRSCMLYLKHQKNEQTGQVRAKIRDISTTADRLNPSGTYKRQEKDSSQAAKDAVAVNDNFEPLDDRF